MRLQAFSAVASDHTVDAARLTGLTPLIGGCWLAIRQLKTDRVHTHQTAAPCAGPPCAAVPPGLAHPVQIAVVSG